MGDSFDGKQENSSDKTACRPKRGDGLEELL